MSDQSEKIVEVAPVEDLEPTVTPEPSAHAGLRDELMELLDVVGPGKLGDVVLDRAFLRSTPQTCISSRPALG
ncbi:MAG: hypothetical protein U0930_11830 [Pirellulales bacterium]